MGEELEEQKGRAKREMQSREPRYVPNRPHQITGARVQGGSPLGGS